MSRPDVFGDVVSHLRLGRPVSWRRHFSTDSGIQPLIDTDGPLARATGHGLFCSEGSPGGGVLLRKFILALLTACLFVTGSPVWGQISLVQVVSCGSGTFSGNELLDNRHQERRPPSRRLAVQRRGRDKHDQQRDG